MGKRYKKPISHSNREIFPRIFPFFEKRHFNKKTEKYIKELLYLSWTDVASSEILYKRKLYPQAIYLLQQSIEKASKADYLSRGVVNLEDLKKEAGHTPHSLLFNEAKLVFEECSKLKGKDPVEIKKNLDSLNEIKKLYKKPDDVILFISKFKGSETIIRNAFNRLGRVLHNVGKYKVIGSNFFNKNVNKKNKLINISPELTQLSNVFSVFNEKSRYPNDLLNPSEYSNKMELIKQLPNIYKRMARILFIMDPKTAKEIICYD